MIMYTFNFGALPKQVCDVELANGIKSFMIGMMHMHGAINQKAYDRLDDWQKKYWIAFEGDEDHSGLAHQLSELLEEYINSAKVHHDTLPISAKTRSFEGFARWLREYK